MTSILKQYREKKRQEEIEEIIEDSDEAMLEVLGD